ncbi:hypothetical protein LguiB_008898 [Lonicera macranthoides]
MGNPLPSSIRFQDLARIVASNRLGPTVEEDVLRNHKKWMKLKSHISDFRNRKIEELPVKPLRQTVEDVFRFQKKKIMDVKSESSNSAKPKHVTRFKTPKESPVKPLRPTAEDLLSLRNKKKMMTEVKSKSCKSDEEEEEEKSRSQNNRMPLAEVVSDCENRWFEDTLKGAEAGDRVMQILVGQMYFKGYGVTKDVFEDVVHSGQNKMSNNWQKIIGDIGSLQAHQGQKVTELQSCGARVRPTVK